MRSTFHGIEVAKRSLFTQQAALNTTGHNIANANTAGYSRQVVNMVAARPIEAVGIMRSGAPGQLGTGVEFDSITRVRERFLDEQYWNENKSLGTWTIRNDTLEKLEAIVNEPSKTGIRSVLSSFWQAWSDLSKDPENLDARKVVRENALALADALNDTYKKLTDLKNDLTENISVKTDQINSIINTIANLNAEIYRIEGLGDHANDLRDQRDLLVDELSKIVNVEVTETPQGYTIDMGGVNLVTGFAAAPVTPEGLEAAYASGDLNSGEVHGMILSRDIYVEQYIQELNQIANTIANGEIEITLPKGAVIPEGVELNGVTYTGTVADRTLASDLTVTVKGLNGLHQLGYHFQDPPQGGLFFVASDGSGTITAGNIALNPAIEENANLIATSMRVISDNGGETVVKGNNQLALLIAGLQNTRFTFTDANGNTTAEATIDDYFRSIVGQLGVQAKEAERQMSNQQVLVDQVDARRQSVSGVSLDEEMANLIKFQHAYNAAARVMTTVDQCLDKIINGMGVVGR